MEQTTYTIEMIYQDDQVCVTDVVSYGVEDKFLTTADSKGVITGFTLQGMVTFKVIKEEVE